MLVTDDRLLGGRDVVDIARRAVAGGATAVQLRLKSASARTLVELARRLLDAVAVPVLVNDRPDVALAAGTGVHLGPEDLPASLARRLLGGPAIIGVSVGTAGEAANGEAGDYWGVGPFRGTTTKLDAGPALGLEGFRRIVTLAGAKPCIAVGSVRPEDVRQILEAGGAGVAVASGILARDDIEAAAAAYRIQG